MRARFILCLIFALISFNISSGQKTGKKLTITGYVVDGTLAPVANAIVMIDGSKTDIITSERGFYKIKVKPQSSRIGIYTLSNGILEEPVNGRKRINFTFEGLVPVQAGMKDDSGEEEINVGYGTVKRKNMTSPVNKIDGKNPRFAGYNSIYEMIQGEIPGVQVSGTSIRIQGATSFYLSTEPLFVVDGIQTSSINTIHPNMVKSIEVLKGAAAAIYGSSGANGVILINLIGAGDRK